jgi:hypothetical protein
MFGVGFGENLNRDSNGVNHHNSRRHSNRKSMEVSG